MQRLVDGLRRQRANPGRKLHFAVTVFFTVGTVLLLYETIALAGPGNLQPITAYVRCANQDAPMATFVAAVTVSFLLGRWLAPPRRR
jgi:hypothetical protein